MISRKNHVRCIPLLHGVFLETRVNFDVAPVQLCVEIQSRICNRDLRAQAWGISRHAVKKKEYDINLENLGVCTFECKKYYDKSADDDVTQIKQFYVRYGKVI